MAGFWFRLRTCVTVRKSSRALNTRKLRDTKEAIEAQFPTALNEHQPASDVGLRPKTRHFPFRTRRHSRRRRALPCRQDRLGWHHQRRSSRSVAQEKSAEGY